MLKVHEPRQHSRRNSCADQPVLEQKLIRLSLMLKRWLGKGAKQVLAAKETGDGKRRKTAVENLRAMTTLATLTSLTTTSAAASSAIPVGSTAHCSSHSSVVGAGSGSGRDASSWSSDEEDGKAKGPEAEDADEKAADPHQLRARFVRTHQQHFEDALNEIRNGQKRSHWSWYIIPTPPFIVNGVERGSWQNKEYALRSDDQCVGYLQLPITDGVDLRGNYLLIMQAIAEQFAQGVKPLRLMGHMDEPKLQSSAKYFQRIATEIGDVEVADACAAVLAGMAKKP